LFCKYSIDSFSWDKKKMNKGLGILPLNFLAHFNVEKEKKAKISVLKKQSNLPILILNEGMFAEFNN